MEVPATITTTTTATVRQQQQDGAYAPPTPSPPAGKSGGRSGDDAEQQPPASPPPPAVSAGEALRHSFTVGLSGGGATIFSVATMMWLHTIITYQQRHGSSFADTCKVSDT